MRDFQADGAVLRRSWGWTAIPAALFVVGAWMLAAQSYGGVICVNVAAVGLAIGLLKKPRRESPAVITLERGVVLANFHERLASVDSVAGVSILEVGKDRMLSITKSDGRVIDLVFEAEDAALELRAALGHAIAPAAARRFSGHAEIGPVGALVVIALSLAMLIVTFASTRFDDHVSTAIGTVLSLVVVPILFARLRRARLTCGAEGVLVEGVLRKRLLPWSTIQATGIREGSVVLREWPRVGFDLSSREDADLFILFARQQGAAAESASGGDSHVESVLGRGERDVATWLADVHAATKVREAYRQAHIDESRLWATLANPRAESSARIGAAVALRIRVGTAALAQLRAAAHATSFPDLRNALNAASDTNVDDAAVAHHVARAIA